jgi:hypothetical protein
MNKPKLKEISHLRGLSGQVLFAMDTQSVQGKAVCHFVRLETIAFDNGPAFDASTFTVMHPDADPRLVHLASSFTAGLAQTAGECGQVLETVILDKNLPAWAKLRLAPVLACLAEMAKV